MTRILFHVNEVLAFLLELAALAFIAYGGLKAGGFVAAVALPLAAAMLWGLFAAPRARFTIPAAQLAVKALVFGGGAMALAGAGHPIASLVFGAIVGANIWAATAWRSRGFEFGR